MSSSSSASEQDGDSKANSYLHGTSDAVSTHFPGKVLATVRDDRRAPQLDPMCCLRVPVAA